MALSLSDPFVAKIFADNLRAVIGDGVDLVFCNKGEAPAFTQTKTVDEACGTLRQSEKTFAVTDRAQCAIVFDGKDTVSIPVFLPMRLIQTALGICLRTPFYKR